MQLRRVALSRVGARSQMTKDKIHEVGDIGLRHSVQYEHEEENIVFPSQDPINILPVKDLHVVHPLILDEPLHRGHFHLQPLPYITRE